ncbi:MAG: Crp/Fnr family transcriptional regulator [Anaerotignum sp.]|jgi:CRP-like cAMP-binding protein|nr:Crp/Fnr family transcriptional regulator [Anaerotignum sp.]MCI8867012.1 Crp/Fnr family transcriptional regulator [Anaerotignum sp.]
MENLSKTELFSGISDEDIQQMLVCFQSFQKNYKEKETISIRNSFGDYIGLLLEGCISISRIRMDGSLDMLEYIEDSGIFGDAFTFGNQEDAILVLCEQDCRVLFIEKHHIIKRCPNACLHHSRLVENLMHLMAGKVMRLTEKVDILSHRSIRGKLLCYFRILSTQAGSPVFPLPFSLMALANFLCVDRSAMMRELKKMKEEGILERNGKMMRLL